MLPWIINKLARWNLSLAERRTLGQPWSLESSLVLDRARLLVEVANHAS